jgi:hypothetical protein
MVPPTEVIGDEIDGERVDPATTILSPPDLLRIRSPKWPTRLVHPGAVMESPVEMWRWVVSLGLPDLDATQSLSEFKL